MAAKKNDSIVTAICRQTTIPKNVTIIRLPGTGNARPSAIAPPFFKPVLNWATPPTVGALLPNDEAVVITTNDPLHAAIWTDKNNGAIVLTQLWVFSGSPDDNNIAISPAGKPPLDTDLYCSVPLNPLVGAFHGPRLFAMRHKGKYYMWCDGPLTLNANCTLRVSTGATAMLGTDAVNVAIYRLNDGDELQVFSQRVAGPFAAGTIIASTQVTADWYRVELTGDDDNATASLLFTISNTANSEILIHRPLPDLAERMMPLVQAIRVIGSASHAINLVSDQNATGSWVGDQPEGSLIYTLFLRGIAGANGFQRLTTQRGNEVMELKKYNPYTWVAPESEKSWAYQHPFTFNQVGVSNVVAEEITDMNYTIVYLKAGGSGAGTDLARNIQLEFFYAVEFLSEGLWMMPGVSPATNDDEDAARKVLNSMENITHNPAFDDIMKTIGKYVRLSAPVLSLLGPYGKAAGLAAAGIGAGLQALGYRTKKTARPADEQERGDREAEERAKARRMAPRAIQQQEDMSS